MQKTGILSQPYHATLPAQQAHAVCRAPCQFQHGFSSFKCSSLYLRALHTTANLCCSGLQTSCVGVFLPISCKAVLVSASTTRFSRSLSAAGNPVEVVLMALEAAVKVFSADTNSKGFLVPRGCGVIQGDGIGLKTIADILEAVVKKGYSAQVRTSCIMSALDDASMGGSAARNWALAASCKQRPTGQCLTLWLL